MKRMIDVKGNLAGVGVELQMIEEIEEDYIHRRVEAVGNEGVRYSGILVLAGVLKGEIEICE